MGISTVKGVRATARKIVESVLAGSGYRCVDCGRKLTGEEITFTYHLNSTKPRCFICSGVDANVPAIDVRKQAEELTWIRNQFAGCKLH